MHECVVARLITNGDLAGEIRVQRVTGRETGRLDKEEIDERVLCHFWRSK